MDEFTSFMEDWDLQAVVRGCSNSEAFANYSSFLDPQSLLDQENYDLLSFSEIFDSKTSENQEIYTQNNLISATTSNPMSIIPNNCQVKEPDDDQKLMIKKQSFSESATTPAATSCDVTMAAKSKRSRKNQQKRVVKHVAADGLSSDMWAWRKYGQKPIKGSPYPRSYYRCSSLKGCLARKQVERSSSDPSIFIITYTAEHSHAHPTRRNSLAGSTRIKSSMAKQLIPNNELPKMATIKNECLDTVSKTPSMGSTEDDLMQNVRIKNEEQEQEEEHVLEDSGSNNNNNNNEIVMPDIIFSDDLFPSLEDFEGLFMDHQFATTVA